MRAVVIIPPVFDFYYTPHRSSGLGGEILLQILHDKGFEAVLLNFPMQSKKGAKLALPSALNHLKPYIIEKEIGPVSFFTKYQRYGPSVSECARLTLETEPDLICISCFAFCYAEAALGLSKTIRSMNPQPTIIVGGAGVSAYPEYFIRRPDVDFSVIGEAEVSLPQFLDAFKSNEKNFSIVPNLYFKSSGRIIAPSKVEQTLSRNIGFVLKKTFTTQEKIFFTTSLSRGCPKNCRFCSNFLSHGRKFRTIPVEVIKNELSEIDHGNITNRKQVCINFEDDNLFCDPNYFFSALKAFKSVFPNAEFFAENGIDYTMIRPGMLSALIESGLKQFNISLASIHPATLQKENRYADFFQYEQIMGILKQHQIPAITYFICGLKQDSKENMISTLLYLVGQPTRLGISFFYPVPGLPDFQRKEIFNEIPPILCAGSSAYPWNHSLSTQEMVTAFRLSRFVNLLKYEKKTAAHQALVEKTIQDRRLYTIIKNGKSHEILPVPNMDLEMAELFFQEISIRHVKKICNGSF